MTPGGWRSRDVPRPSILNKSTNRISVVIFPVLVHQMCVLDTKKLVIAHSISFGEISYEHPKNVPNWHLYVTSLGHPQDINLNIFHKGGFSGDFSIFSDTKCIPEIAEPKLVKNLIRPSLVLLWSRTSWPK